jgi:hypothetical protein
MVSIAVRQTIIGCLLIAAVLTPALSVGAVYSLYRKYYKHMKAMHKNEWFDLMRKDSAIEAIGEWYRWPFGSWYLIVSFFNRKIDYDDEKIKKYKTRAVMYCKLFIVSLTIAIVIIILLPKL